MAPSKWIAEMFSSFPHLDFDFQNTTSIFTPTDTSYQQALMFNGLIIFFISGLVFLVFTFYFLICSCYFCSSCFPSVLKPKPAKSRSLRFFIAVLAVFSCVPLGIGFYGNNKTMDGVQNFSSAATNIYNQWDLYKFKNLVMHQFIQNDAVKSLTNLKQALTKYSIPVPVILNSLEKVIKDILASVDISSKYLDKSEFDFKDLSENVSVYDRIRWWTTIGILLWHLLLVLSVLYGSWRERRLFISIMAIEGILSLLFMISSVGVEVPLSVGAGDLCVNPNAAVTQYMKNPFYRGVQEYYLDCFNGTGNPLFRQYDRSSRLLRMVEADINLLANDPAIEQLLLNETVPYITELKAAIWKSKSDLDELVKALDCKYIHKQYKDGINAVCYVVLYGLSLLILSALIIALFVICILLCLTPIWKSMAKLRSILRRTAPGSVHIITGSYSGPPGGREHFPDSSWDTSLDASYKSIDEDQRDQKDQRDQQRAGRYDTSETVPLVLRRGSERPPSYQAVHGDTEFLSVEEDRRRHHSTAETLT